jgi:hypothetical protein
MRRIGRVTIFGKTNVLLSAALIAAALIPARTARKAVNDRVASTDAACETAGPKGCLALAADAMGGAARLDAVKSMTYESVGHTLLVEQSYRQDPFITSYEHSKVKIDLEGKKVRIETQLTWPESDPGQAESQSVMVASAEGCVRKASAAGGTQDAPCSLSQIDTVRDLFGIGPLRLLATATQAPDLHFEAPKMLRSTPHTVLGFSWDGTPVRILINRFNHLPDVVETDQQLQDFWYYWGDVHRRIYLDNWVTVRGVRYPTNLVEERNGVLWKSTQVLDLKLDVPLESNPFEMDAKVAGLGAKSSGWERSFSAAKASELAPGLTFFPGAWNATLVKQEDGVVVLEAPISGTYVAGVLDEAKKRYADTTVKAVLSTSDSWPHVGGVREAVASKLPVYILDLNQPLLDRFVTAKHEIHPDLLAKAPQKPSWRIVSGKTIVGGGSNRMELYPLRGASTERQYMVYFPEHRLLYASDTLAINDDGSLYDPELMREVMDAVQREGLQVNTVFAMHQAPMPWNDVVKRVRNAMR